MTDAPDYRIIDLETWPRREQYGLYRDLAFPYFSMTADVDVTEMRELVRRLGESFTSAISYAIARAANSVPEFRQRMHRRDGHPDEIREYAVVHPSITVLGEGGQFRFCVLPYSEGFDVFRTQARPRIEEAKHAPSLWVVPDREDFLFMTSIPWIRFTAMTHPVPLDPACSVPRIAWGKFREDADARIRMPLNVQAHHAMIDGLHLGRFYARLQEILDGAGALCGQAPVSREE